MDAIVVEAQRAFDRAFGGPCEMTVLAPGRVNLIGEHTDYNDGFVFPVAIDRWVTFAMRPRADKIARLYSVMHDEMVEFAVDETPVGAHNWADYPKGVVCEFQKLGHALGGFEAAMVGNVPMGAGLSSSAAVEMAVGKGLLGLNKLDLSGSDLALLGQRAENQFVGVNCGIMDQFISANGKEGHALLLDCRDLSYELVPVAHRDTQFVICNTGVSRGLTDSAYNERRAACEEGVTQLAQATGKPIRALRDVSMAMLGAFGEMLSETVLKRCRHVISENDRTKQAASLLKAGNAAAFGQLMDASHASLRDDYEVSCKELDLLVRIAKDVPGVLGARMTGAGFGGCTVNLVAGPSVESLIAAVDDRYERETGFKPEIYVCSAVNGAERVD